MAPPKSLLSFVRVMFLSIALTLDVPVTVSEPLCSTAPVEFAARFPAIVVAASPNVRPAEIVVRLPLVPSSLSADTAVRSVTPVVRCAVRLFASLILVTPPATVSAPTKSLPAFASVTLFVPAAILDVPETVRMPVWYTAPVDVAARLPVTVVAASPKVKPAELVDRLPLVPSTLRVDTAVRSVVPVVRCAVRLFASLMLVVPPTAVNAPPKSLVTSARVTLLLPAAMFDVPVTTSLPV